jgi:hypothetical protein
VRERFGQDEATAMGLKKNCEDVKTTRRSGESKRTIAFARERVLASRAKNCIEIGEMIQGQAVKSSTALHGAG